MSRDEDRAYRERSDDGEHLSVCIRNGVEVLVASGGVSIDTAIGQASGAVENRKGFRTGLGSDGGDQEGQKQR